MNHAEAAIVVATLLAGFPDQVLEPESVDLWTDEIAAFEDAYEAGFVARAFIRGSDKFPTLHSFRLAYHARIELVRQENAKSHGLPEAPREKGVPEWVQVWWWARHTRAPREKRDLPQMASPDAPAGSYMTQSDYLELLGEWSRAGRPSITLANMTAGIAEHA